MSAEKTKSQIFLHNNDSSLSSLPLQIIPAQVSSVGFNTLKKLPTNSSNSSSAATINTVRSKTLARLFTRNRSTSTVNDRHDEPHFPLNASSAVNDDDQQKVSNLFGFTGKPQKFKLRSKGKSRPDLTIQTTGHHSLKLPKKLLNSPSVDDFGKKTALSSMSLNNLFHRPIGQAKLETNHKPNQDESLGVSKPLGSLSQRTSVTLSSQSSNSFVSDKNFAALFNFTEIDYVNVTLDGNLDLPSIQDIHRKYMISTDQFVQSKLHKNVGDASHTVDAYTEQDDSEVMLTPIEADKKIFESFNELFCMIYPLFVPSAQVVLRSGKSATQLLITMEHASNFVRQRIVSNLSDKNRGIKKENSPISSPFEDRSLQDNIDEDATEVEKKELIKELSEFFEKCITLMLTNYRLIRRRLEDSNTRSINEFSNRPRNPNTTTKENKCKCDLKVKDWETVCGLWKYFNTKVRFFMLNAFYPLQAHFVEERILQKRYDSIEIQIESLLMKAFRDAIITPHLSQRASEISKTYSHLGELSQFHPLYLAELAYFKENTDIYKTLRKCFGVIRSHLSQASMHSDDKLAGELEFEEFVQWFNSVVR